MLSQKGLHRNEAKSWTAADRSLGRTAVADSCLQDTVSCTSWVALYFAVRPETPKEGYVAVFIGLSGFLRKCAR